MLGTHVRLPAELWRRIDAYRRSHPEMPSRPGAIKELVEQRLDEIEAAHARATAKGKSKP